MPLNRNPPDPTPDPALLVSLAAGEKQPPAPTPSDLEYPMSPLSLKEQTQELHDALEELWAAVVEALMLREIVAWLAKRLGG
jgi:hypothetical protein